MIDKLIKISKINPNPYLYYNHFDEIKGKAYKEILQDLEVIKMNKKEAIEQLYRLNLDWEENGLYTKLNQKEQK